LKIFIILFVFFYHSNVNAINIATVDLDRIINKSSSYLIFLEKINIFIAKESAIFKDNEAILQANKLDIESKKSILNESEFNKLILNHNDQLNIYQNNITKFNLLIDENIEINKKIIIDKILEILETVSIEKNYDLVLTNNNFLLAQNKFDISNQVINKLNEYEIILNTYKIN
tara:strand:+ start:139 stop:657 length:519 start_codon:yes stop_codon:yes gene_type:complete